MAESARDGSPDESFKKALNLHGFGFQHAVIEVVRTRCPSWRVDAVEAPVVVRGQEARIDFVLSTQSGPVIVAECKRVDRAKGHWCFIRADAQRGNSHIEVYSRTPDGRSFARPKRSVLSPAPFQVGLEVRDPGKPGDGVGSHRPALELAVTQAFRAASGLLNLLRDNPNLARNGAPVVPVVFTTAALFSTDTDLSSASLNDGHLSELALTPRDWIWFEENVSGSLHHDLPGRFEEIADFGTHVRRGHSRVCGIVNAASTEDFLTHLAWNPLVV